METPRPLPSNQHSEEYCLSAVLAYELAETELIARGFHVEWLNFPKHRSMWEMLVRFRARTKTVGEIDAVTLLSELLKNKSVMDEIGGPAAITELRNNICILDPAQLDYHVQTLKDCWQRRRAISLANQLEAKAYQSDDFDKSMADSITELGAISSVPASNRIVNGYDALQEFIADISDTVENGKPNEAPALKCGIPELDDRIGGMVPYFWLIGADTSGGKTALSLQLVRSILEQGGRVLVFALEMRARQLIRRLVSAAGKIPIQRLVKPETLNEYDFAKLSGPGSSWNAKDLLICDDGDVTIQEVRAICRAEHAKQPLACVLVDYIQLASAGRFRDGANREQEISFIGSQCVKMAKELGCPVIGPTQLNDDGKVRESRALKHHAAIYLVIEQDKILCAKNRDGARDWSIPYTLTGDIQTFEKTTQPY
jgi:replicative DNA helicase